MSLGPPIRDPIPPEPEWKPYEQNPRLEVNARGQLRTREAPAPVFLDDDDFSTEKEAP